MISVLKFKTEYPLGKEPYDMVLLAPVGEGHQKTQTWLRVKSLMPPEHWDETKKASQTFQDMQAKWSIIGPAYKAYKEGNEIPEDGTPLAIWPGVTSEMADAFRKMGIKTVEAVRDMNDGAIGALPFPNARKLPELAREYLEGKATTEKDAEILALKEQLAALTEVVNSPKRGRPKKESVDA